MSDDLKKSQDYSASSIRTMDDREHVRLRPAMYIGDTGVKGLHHLVSEVVDNSIDEYSNGHGTSVQCVIHLDGSVSVTDDGRGIPVDIHPTTNQPACETVMTMLRAGGKFDSETYKKSSGLHGIGVSAVNMLSTRLELRIWRDGFEWLMSFEEGLTKDSLKKVGPSNGRTGTQVKFWPDAKIFQTTEFIYERLEERLKELSFLNKGIRIAIRDERDESKVGDFYSEDGIAGFVSYLRGEKTPVHEQIVYLLQTDKETNCDVEVAFQYNEQYSSNVLSYANNINTHEGGTHLTGLKSALLEAITAYGEKKKLFKGQDIRPTPSDVLEGLIAVVSVKLAGPEFEGQTKSKLGTPWVKEVVRKLVASAIDEYFTKNPEAAEKVTSKIVMAVIAREEARKAKELVRRKNVLSSAIGAEKLADCSEKDPSLCEIFIVEGDSAGGSAKQGRNRKFQAVLPLKGKVLNVEKSVLTKIMDNKEIKSLISTLGINIQTGDISRLRYHKIIITCDADVDGAHISTLILTLIYKYMRPLIDNGHVYLAQPPLYKVKYGKENRYIADDEALDKWKVGKNPENMVIKRFKGLGEMNPDQLAETTLSPDTRRLARVVVSNDEETSKMFTVLMGSDVAPRKEFIMTHADSIDEEQIDA